MQLHVGLKTCNQTDSCCRIFYEQTWRLRIFKTYYNNSLWHSSKIKKDVISSVQIVVNATALISGQYFQLVIKYIRLFTVFFFFKFETHLNLRPGGGSEVAIRTLEGVCVQVRPLVVLHVRTSVKRLHAYSTGKPFSVQTGGAYSGGGGRSFTAQLMENRHSQRENRLGFLTKNFEMVALVTSTC